MLDHLTLTAHGVCYLWRPGLIWMHAISDLAIALAYFSIPLLLGLAFHTLQGAFRSALAVWFAAFILCCGLTHVLEIVTIWIPIYYLQAGVKIVTAVVSIGALHALYQVVVAARPILDSHDRDKLHLAIDEILGRSAT